MLDVTTTKAFMTALISTASYNTVSTSPLHGEDSITGSSLTITGFIVSLLAAMNSILPYFPFSNLYFQNQAKSKNSFLLLQKFASRKSVTRLLREPSLLDNNHIFSNNYEKKIKLKRPKTTEGFDALNRQKSYSLSTIYS
jgi:hypothetical protein